MSPRGRVLLPRGAARARWTNDEDGGVRALFVAEARAPAADDEAGGRSINAASVVVVGVGGGGGPLIVAQDLGPGRAGWE